MRHKAVLVGTQQSALDDFFKPMDGMLHCVTSSLRLEDIENHIEFFKPDFFIFCMKNETVLTLQNMRKIKQICNKHRTYFVILGSAIDCAFFKKAAAGVADIVLEKPMAMTKIYEKLQVFYDALHGQAEIDRISDSVRMSQREKLSDNMQKMMSESTPAGQQMIAPQQMTVEEALAAIPQKKHILVVDDDPGMLKLIRSQLEDDYEVATAINGALALRFLAHKTTDLVLLDYEMPGNDGAMILENIRGHEFSKNIPVVFLTGVTDAARIRKALALKPDGYLLKPIDKATLVATLREKLKA